MKNTETVNRCDLQAMLATDTQAYKKIHGVQSAGDSSRKIIKKWLQSSTQIVNFRYLKRLRWRSNALKYTVINKQLINMYSILT